jgi:hypothetical protein
LQKARPPLEVGSRDRENGEVCFPALKGIDGVAGHFNVLPAPTLLFEEIIDVFGLGGITGENGNGYLLS